MQLPPGFELDTPTSQNASGQLPQGFELDTPDQGPDRARVSRWTQYLDQQNRRHSPENVSRPDYTDMIQRVAEMSAANGEPPRDEVNAAGVPLSDEGRPSAFATGVGDTFSFGFGDEAGGAIAGGMQRVENAARGLFGDGLGQDPTARGRNVRENMRSQARNSWEDHPVTTGAGAITGGVASAVAAGAAAPAQAARIAQVARGAPLATGAALGAVEGAAYGVGSGEDGAGDRLQSGAMGAALGGATGGLIPAAGLTMQGGGRVARQLGGEVVDAVRNRGVAVPEIDALRAATTQAYQAVDDLGARYSTTSTRRFADDVSRTVQADNLNPRLSPRSAAIVDEITAMGERELSLTELEQFRRAVRRDLASSTEPSERHFGGVIIDQIDTFIGNARPQGAVGQQGAQAIRAARQASRTQRASEVLQDAIEAATNRSSSTGTGGNTQNAIRQEIRRIITNKRTRNLYTAEQRALLLRVVRGDNIQNTLRLVGTLSPDRGFLPLVGGLGSAAAAGPAGLAVPAVGYAARQIAEARQGAMLDNAVRAVRGPG